jgi:hypothetical protein
MPGHDAFGMGHAKRARHCLFDGGGWLISPMSRQTLLQGGSEAAILARGPIRIKPDIYGAAVPDPSGADPPGCDRDVPQEGLGGDAHIAGSLRKAQPSRPVRQVSLVKPGAGSLVDALAFQPSTLQLLNGRQDQAPDRRALGVAVLEQLVRSLYCADRRVPAGLVDQRLAAR